MEMYIRNSLACMYLMCEKWQEISICMRILAIIKSHKIMPLLHCQLLKRPTAGIPTSLSRCLFLS